MAQGRDQLIGALIVCMPLLMPYYMDYDLLLLAIPATLFAAERCRDRGGRLNRSIAGPTSAHFDSYRAAAWATLFFATFAQPVFSAFTRVNVTVPALAITAAFALAACLRGRGEAVTIGGPAPRSTWPSPSDVAAA